jgi:Methyltransferase domain
MIQFLKTLYLKPLKAHFLKKENELPKVALLEKNMENCELLLNRSALLSKLKHNAVAAEIGVNKGEFSKEIMDKTSPVALHLVDVWDTQRYHSGLYELVTRKFAKAISEDRVVIHRALSTDACGDFEGNFFDWIYIDTDHSYKTTRDELKLYAPKMKKGGVIAGHDYSMGAWDHAYRYGVVEAVQEFCVENDWEMVYLTLDSTENQSFAIRKI